MSNPTIACRQLTISPVLSDVLALMAEGRTNSAISRALVVTDGAVEKHISSIFTNSACRRPTTTTAA